MTTLPEQLSAARKNQLEAQLELFRSLGAQALSSAGQLIALNLNASRSSVEQSSAAVRQLMAARDPRDLLAIGAQGQQQFQNMINYSRELFSIAAGVQIKLQAAAVPAAATPAAPHDAGTAASDAIAAAARSSRAPGKVVVEAQAEPEPELELIARATPIASAASQVAAAPVQAPHPVASPLPAPAAAVEIPKLKPVEAAPPAAARQTAAPAPKGTRRK